MVGTGIGLHLCREFVKLHNGAISVRSEVGKGSTFTVSLPIELPEIQEIITSPDKPDTTGNVESGGVSEPENLSEQLQETGAAETLAVSDKPTLLIVDDNADFREFMKLSLSGAYRVFTADDGEQAWEVILEELPDMVVSDVMMPVTDGIVLCKRIKQDIRTSHIPVILLTAKSAEESKLTGLEAGCRRLYRQTVQYGHAGLEDTASGGNEKTVGKNSFCNLLRPVSSYRIFLSVRWMNS